ncbi:ENV1 protein, partial [Brachypodius atriceps]|nr:ENV1 protein [Brachypodius atriceps]
SQELCASTARLDKQMKWAIPAEGNIWACHTTGLTPCIFIKHFDESNNFCIQVTVVPRILYHTDEEIMTHFEAQPHRTKREVFTAISLAALLALGGTGAATGITSLATQRQGLLQLQQTIDEDLLEIHKNIVKLEESLFSLSEMVLQNRRGLELLLMQQGGLCAAQNEECCTYVNHSGPIRQSMAELKNRLERRSHELQQQNWFGSLFTQHPWIAPVVSTLIGPLVVIMLALIFGPCLFNKITQFVKARLSTIEIMLLQRKQLT